MVSFHVWIRHSPHIEVLLLLRFKKQALVAVFHFTNLGTMQIISYAVMHMMKYEVCPYLR